MWHITQAREPFQKQKNVLNEEKNNLPDLPPSNDKFWSKARKYGVDLTKKKPICEHYFEYKMGREVVCKKCNNGFYFTGKEYLENGMIKIRD